MILTLIGNGASRATGVDCGEIEEMARRRAGASRAGNAPARENWNWIWDKATPTKATERITSMVCYDDSSNVASRSRKTVGKY
jgi:uncharacterized protein YmfQ (DUF2313 family)